MTHCLTWCERYGISMLSLCLRWRRYTSIIHRNLSASIGERDERNQILCKLLFIVDTYKLPGPACAVSTRKVTGLPTVPAVTFLTFIEFTSYTCLFQKVKALSYRKVSSYSWNEFKLLLLNMDFPPSVDLSQRRQHDVLPPFEVRIPLWTHHLMSDELVQELSGRSVLHACDGFNWFSQEARSRSVLLKWLVVFCILRVFVLSVVWFLWYGFWIFFD